jgi:hypothetical protein
MIKPDYKPDTGMDEEMFILLVFFCLYTFTYLMTIKLLGG